jgi:hypothetical protein
MKMSPFGSMALVGVGVVVAGLVWLAIRGGAKDQEAVREIDRTVVAEYARLVAEGRFAEAHEKCLAASYRRAAPLEKFVAAHEKRRLELGPLQGCKLLRFTAHRNLFSPRRELQLLYELTYPGGPRPEYVTVDDVDGAWRIEGTYHLSAGGTFDFMVW